MRALLIPLSPPRKTFWATKSAPITRYDRIVSYFQELAKLSDRVSYQEIGYTVGHRPTIVLTITSPENHANLEQIRQDHLTISDPNRVVNEFTDHPKIGRASCSRRD